MKSFLKYPGSKWRIAKQLAELIPQHHSYVEPYFGSGALLFNKAPSNIETINDLDNNVVNLFKCIQKDANKLASLAAATPYARSIYEDAFQEVNNEYEKALYFMIRCNMGHGYRTTGERFGWKNDIVGRERSYALSRWYKLPADILEIAERLKSVQIESRRALEVIERFNYENVFMYIDPPCLMCLIQEMVNNTGMRWITMITSNY